MPLATLRPCAAHDEAFLQDLYASTRTDALAALGWGPAQEQAFVRMQFQAQRLSYLAQFPAAEYRIVQRNGADAGRLIVDRSEDVIRLIDISLLPAHRNAGIGTGLICDLLAEATRTSKAVMLHVDRSNRAQRLYERLGFVPMADDEIYTEMAWRPRADLAG